MGTNVIGANMPSDIKTKKKRHGMWYNVVQRLFHYRYAVVGLIGLVVLILIAVFAPLLAPYDPLYMDLAHMNATPSWSHLMGTDNLGRDILSRLMYGGRWSMSLGLISAFTASFFGVIFGSISGYFGGWVDNLIMRICDVLQSIPAIMISIIVSLVLGGSLVVTALALALGGITTATRVTRGKVLQVRDEEYLAAAKCINCSTPRILFKHILPNVISPILIGMTMTVGSNIMNSAGLSVLGLGIQPPTPEWGAMLSSGLTYIRNYPHLLFFPGLFIFVTCLCVNLFGDGLRDAIDPKMKK